MKKEESRELTDEELESVIGGQSREAFLIWKCHRVNEVNASKKRRVVEHPLILEYDNITKSKGD